MVIFFCIFSALFFQGFRPPQKKKKRPTFTPRIVGIPSNCAFSNPNSFHADFLLMGDIINVLFSIFLRAPRISGISQQFSDISRNKFMFFGPKTPLIAIADR